MNAGVSLITNAEAKVPEIPCYSEEDLQWLSRVIYAESGNESDELQLAVGSVVLNRVESEYYPGTIKGVIFDTNYGVQYGCTLDGNLEKTPDERAIKNATKLLTDGSILPPNVLGQTNVPTLDGVYEVIDGVVFSFKEQ